MRFYNVDTKRVTELHFIPLATAGVKCDYLVDMFEDGCFDRYDFRKTDVPSCDYEMDGEELDEFTKYVNYSNYITALYNQADDEERRRMDDAYDERSVWDIWEPIYAIFELKNVRWW